MIHLALRSEFSFRQSYAPINKLVQYAVDNDMPSLGIADVNNTFGHFPFVKACEKAGIKPILGVRLNTLFDDKQRVCNVQWIYIAKNDEGLVELYKLVKTAYDQFYYIPRLNARKDVLTLSDNIEVLTPYRIDKNALESGTEPLSLEFLGGITYYSLNSGKTVPIVDNRYITPDDKPTYQLLSGVVKRADGYHHSFDDKTYSQHIWTDQEYILDTGDKEGIDNTYDLSLDFNVKLPEAPMVKYTPHKDLRKICERFAKQKGVDLTDEVYRERLDRELDIITERDFNDYFLIVSDLLLTAKKTTLVGPARGSSGGSLVCYLMGITEIDPIKYGLIFERFVDLNRIGLPDIDTDIPDHSRKNVIKYIHKKYGEEQVKTIGTITTFKAKSVIGDIGKSLNYSPADMETLKDSIIERQGGDDRANMCISDTFNDTEIGKEMIEKYPNLIYAGELEGHAVHEGKHAAGVIIANKPLYHYCGINSRESTIMMTGKDAEAIGLLKIDVLGLRTLSVLEETAKLAGFNYKDYYTLPLDDPKVFDIFNQGRLYGIFQFEGAATKNLTRQITVEHFDDLCSLTALSRPGALISGEAARYIKRKNGLDDPVYYGDIYKDITQSTYGAVVFQEQGMTLMKDYAGMSWLDVNTLRKAISKSYGIEFFMKYKDIFINGAKELGRDEEEANLVWDTISSMGSYSFNKSHAVGYSIISYWTAYCKAYYPMEFAAANLNNAKDEDNAVKILRDFVKYENVEYISVDPDLSDVKWSIYDNKLIGGLTNIKGIGDSKAKDIIKMRNGQKAYTPGIVKKLMEPETPFDILFPIQHYFGHYYNDPVSYGLYNKPNLIEDVNDPGNYIIVGKIKLKDLVFRNNPQLILKRGGKILEDNLYYLKLIVEDDTGDIVCQIPPFKFDELEGKHLAEKLSVDKSYVIIKGSIQGSFRMLSIEAISEVTPNE